MRLSQLAKWLPVAILASVLGMFAISVLAAPITEPKLAVRVADLPEVSRHPIPQEMRSSRIKATAVWIVKDGSTWRAFSNQSTHRPCKSSDVQWYPEHGVFMDPCYGSVWNRSGKNIAGPAPRGLDWFPVTVEENGWLVVDLSHLQLDRSENLGR
jgi:Rieske Fe-S protein